MAVDNTKFRGLYHFNSGGVGTDDSNNGNDLTITGTTNPVGKLNEALFTDVVDDTVFNDSIISDLANDTEGAFPFWTNVDDLAANAFQVIFSVSRNTDSTTTELYVAADTRVGQDKFLVVMTIDGTNQWIFSVDTAISAFSGFANFILTHDSIAPEIYINDSLEAITFSTSTNKTKWMKALITEATSPADRFAIGILYRNGVGVARGQIKIDELIISGQHFTSTEVSEYWNGGAGQEFSGVSGNSRRKIIQQRILNV